MQTLTNWGAVNKGRKGHDTMLEELQQGGVDNAVNLPSVVIPSTWGPIPYNHQ